jgi:hypothetical protein
VLIALSFRAPSATPVAVLAPAGTR